MPPMRWLLAVFFAQAVLAGEMPAARAAAPAVAAAETAVRLGVVAGYGDYEENVTPQDTETGALLGANFNLGVLQAAGFDQLGFSDIYADGEYDFTRGFLRYRGNLQDYGLTYRAPDNADEKTAIVRLGVGRPFARGQELIPYVAGGFQNWYHNIGGPHGISEYYQAGLLGGGLKLDVMASSRLVVGADAEGYAVFGGSVAAPSTEFNGGFGTSAEERVGLDADYRLSPSWHVTAGVGAVHYGYTGSRGFEPLSSTVQINSMLGFSYGF